MNDDPVSLVPSPAAVAAPSPALSRRDFLRISSGAAAAVSMGAMPAAGGQAPRLGASPFSLGVASGDPLPDGVVLWTRLDREVLERSGQLRSNVPVRWEVAEDEGFRRVIRKGSNEAPTLLGHSVHVEADGLRPGREYWYRFMLGDETSVTGRTRTAPARRTALDRLRFAFASCQHYEQGYYTAFRHLASEDLELVVHLGDYIYERSSGDVRPRRHEAGEVFTLDQYRARYTLYRSDADLQAAHAACPWIVTTDDHEVSNNYAGEHAENPAETPEKFLARRAAAFQAFYEFLPLRRSSMPSGPGIRLFRRVSFGDLAQFHVLDTRQYRSDQACGDGRKPRCPAVFETDRTMMGAEQERWLMDGLRSSDARWNVLANQVMIAQLAQSGPGDRTFSMDRWDGYIAARNRLLGFLGSARPSNPVVITGDIHSNWVADLKLDFDNPASRTVGTEFVGTSISSGGDGNDGTGTARSDLNPHIKFFNSRRGYVRVTVTPALWTAEYRVLPYVTKPGAPVETRASFVVESGRPGAQFSG